MSVSTNVFDQSISAVPVEINLDPDSIDSFELCAYSYTGLSPTEIKTIHQQWPILELLDAAGAIYPGGYALALYAGNQPHTDLYGDIDILHRDTTRTSELIDLVRQTDTVVKEHVTNRATSLWCQQKDQILMLQFVTSWNQNLETILSAFDYDNCKVCYDPKTEQFLVHEDLNYYLGKNQLHLSTEWLYHAPPNSLSLSIPRAVKYCKRWDWNLDNWCLKQLTDLWLHITPDKRWLPPDQVDSGRGIINQGSDQPDTIKLGYFLQELYTILGKEPPAEILVGPPNDAEILIGPPNDTQTIDIAF